MSRRLAGLITAVAVIGAGSAYAQETNAGPGKIEVTVIPGGAMFFTDHNGASFKNYNLGGGATYNINRIVGIEGEVGGSIGLSQDLTFAGLTTSEKTPNILTYTGNVVASIPTRTSVVPYATGGVGGLSMFKRPELGINSTDTFLTGNVGGGVKWYAPNGRWGLRGDYRFLATRSNDSSSAFFGPDTRYANRIYGAVIINAVR